MQTGPIVKMKRVGWLLCLTLLTAAMSAAAQNEDLALDELVRSAEQWAAENLDEDFLKALQSGDQEKVQQFLAELEKRFRAEYVLDLASARDAAKGILPLLDQYEETVPYALWLRTRLDYLDVAEQLRRPRPIREPKTEPPPKPATAPSPEKLREAWRKKVVDVTWPERAKPYVSRLKPIFVAEKVPPELVWVAEVESSFDPRARSPAGAAGLFQLMPGTAQHYGLRTMWPLDQRLKAEPSARAAARYLRFLHERYKDWPLALAAYNAGQGRVDRLLAVQKERRFEKIACHLPAETQMYVPKLEATLLRREGVTFSQLRAPESPATKPD